MESLAALVAALLSIIIFSGPIGILLTLSPIWNMTLRFLHFGTQGEFLSHYLLWPE